VCKLQALPLRSFHCRDGIGQADTGTEVLWEGMGSCYIIVSFRVENAVVLREG